MLRCNLIRFSNLLVPKWHQIRHSHADEFAKILGSNGVQTTDLDAFNSDWLSSHKGCSSIVLFPKTTEDVSQILKYSFEHKVKCVVQSGNTSLVVGSVPIDDEVIISMRRMNKIINLDDDSGVLQCESGCILQDLEQYVNNRNRLIPYDLGAKGSCLIGGNIATNAGGLRFIRYGPLHGNVLGLEIVLPNGKILDLMSSMRKDNTGYHLRHLFIGSEGTLGIITKVAILCPMQLKHRIVSLIAIESFEKLLQFYSIVQRELGEFISCFEMMDRDSMHSVVENLKFPQPLSQYYPFYVMFELSSNDQTYIEDRLLKLYSKLQSNQTILDGTFSSDSDWKNFSGIKQYRESITESLKRDGYCYKYDISLPLKVYYEAVRIMYDRLEDSDYVRICGYGHIGDGNLHLNVTSKKYDPKILELIEPFLYEFVSKHRGSISAEHGIGYKKRQYLKYSKSYQSIELMKEIKKLIDPNLILNDRKLFD